ncbi:helix-turn-helix domain-containing protein [Arenimonas caeni]|uniref:HTH cro/C1-type domain-containing protein n=1 Tax=Arenimonas caeni TaxID=2058085 RepID=A0A2P6M7M4_9GAMM|nr:helix-turn-helix transcriptional regulator [Arenimonas caeni]PRH81978.1 hypothetical protein C6N40_09235 [Arenimonas caeni]
MSYQEWLKNEANQASLRQEELIVSVTGSIIDAMDRAQLSKADLAAKLGVSRSYITQILSGNRNMTLRTLADISHAIDHGVYFSLRPRVSSFLKVSS